MEERAKLDPPAESFKLFGYQITILERIFADPDPDHIVFAYVLIESIGDVRFFTETDVVEVKYRRAPNDNGRGPDLILMSWSGGLHCCSTLHVFQFQKHFDLREISTGDGGGEFVRDKAGRPLRFEFQDSNFAYWNVGFASSPMPNVVLKWSGDRYVADRAAMLKPPPDDAAFAKMGREVVAALSGWNGPYVPLDDEWDVEEHGQPRGGVEKPAPPPILWDHLLKLIYAGHARLAVRLFDETWPQGVEGKAAFWRDFTRRLRRSPTWREYGLERLLGARPLFAYNPR
jgi:hypothetical protein